MGLFAFTTGFSNGFANLQAGEASEVNHLVTRGYGTGPGGLPGNIKSVVVRGYLDTGLVAVIVSGTAIAGLSDEQIRNGGETIILTLFNDTWVADIGSDSAATTALINGIDGSGSEANGWDAVVKAGLTYENVERTSDTEVTIALPSFGHFEITADEVVTITAAASTVTGAVELSGLSPIDVRTTGLVVVEPERPGGRYGRGYPQKIRQESYFFLPKKKKRKKVRLPPHLAIIAYPDDPDEQRRFEQATQTKRAAAPAAVRQAMVELAGIKTADQLAIEAAQLALKAERLPAVVQFPDLYAEPEETGLSVDDTLLLLLAAA